MNSCKNLKWTKPYFGVSHLGSFSMTERWASIADYGSFCILYKYFPGCGFHPKEKTFDSLEEAKRVGEAWMMECE